MPVPENLPCPSLPSADPAPGRKIERMTMEVFKPLTGDMIAEPTKLGLPSMPDNELKPKGVTKSRLSLKPTLVKLILMKKKLDKP
jgi:hypothetical protein